MASIPTITTIQPTECIGNSLFTLNTNYNNIKNSFTDAKTDIEQLNSNIDILTNKLNSLSANSAAPGIAKAWVYFNPELKLVPDLSGNPSFTKTPDNTNRYLENSFNIQSVKKESTGQYLVTFANPIGGNFVVSGITSSLPGQDTGPQIGIVSLPYSGYAPGSPPFNTQCLVRTYNLLGAYIDPTLVMLTFYSY